MGVPNDNWVLSHINKDYEVYIHLLEEICLEVAFNTGKSCKFLT